MAVVCNYASNSTQHVDENKTCNILDYFVSSVDRHLTLGIQVNYVIGLSVDCFILQHSTVISLSQKSFSSSRSLNRLEQDILFLTLMKSLKPTSKRKNRL